MLSNMSLDKAYEKVREFHQAFGHPSVDAPSALSAERRNVRADWMREEVQEWVEANDPVDQADAMIDLIYFALGSLVELGIKPQELFDVVHQANMAKLWEDGRPRYDATGKVIKPEGWRDPDDALREVIHRQLSDSGFLGK